MMCLSNRIVVGVLALALAACASQSPAPIYQGTERTQRSAVTSDSSSAGGAAPVVTRSAAEGMPLEPANPDGERVALLLPLSEPRTRERAVAHAMARAAQLANEDLAGRALNVTVFDTAGAGGAAVAAQAAIDNGAQLILGPLLEPSVRAARAVAERSGVNMIAFSTAAEVASESVFLIGSLPEQEFSRVLEYAVARGHYRMDAIAPTTPYGDIAVRELNRVTDREGTIPVVERYAPNFDGASAIAEVYAQRRAQRLARNPDSVATAVLLPETGLELSTIVGFLQVHRQPTDEVRFLGTGLWDSDIVFGEEGLIGAWFAAPDPRLRPEFVRRYVAQFESEPAALAPMAYDAVAIAGLLAAGPAGERFTADAITDPAGFRGIGGAIRFLPDGRNQRALSILEIGDREFRVVDPAPLTFEGY